jgi:hypothetical protein
MKSFSPGAQAIATAATQHTPKHSKEVTSDFKMRGNNKQLLISHERTLFEPLLST